MGHQIDIRLIYREQTDVIVLATHAHLNIYGMRTPEDNTRAIHQILSLILRKLILIFLPFSYRYIVPGCFCTKYNNELILLMTRIHPAATKIEISAITGH